MIYEGTNSWIGPNDSSIRICLAENHSDLPIFLYDRIDSTNSEAKRLYLNGNRHDKLVVAREQFGGKGRMGRSFYSPSDSGLYMTLAFTTERSLADAVMITVAASVAVLRAVKKHTGLTLGIKWVNDLYLGDKKVCGILAESVGGTDQNHIILGIGINLSTASFPEELKRIAGSLGMACDINPLIADIVNELYGFWDEPECHTYMDDYRSHSIVLGKEVICYKGNESFVGIAQQITDRGALLVRDPRGNIQIMDSGEITLRFTS